VAYLKIHNGDRQLACC